MRILRRLAIGLGAMLVLLLVVAAGGLLWLRSEGGRDWVTAMANDALAEPDQRITLSGLEGGLPFHLRLKRIDMADRDGVWLSVEDAAIDLDGWALLHGTARIEDLTAAAIEVKRSPAPSNAPPIPPSTEPFALPKLPVGIELEKLSIARVTLAPELAGESVALSLDGQAGLHAGTAKLKLTAQRIDGNAGKLDLAAAYGVEGGAADALQLKLEAEEPSGELLARALPSGEKLPLSITLGGDGRLSLWRGKLAVTAGSASHINADLAIGQGGGDTSIEMAGDAVIAALLPEATRPAIGDDAHFDIAARIADAGPIGLDKLNLTLRAGTVKAAGRFDPKGDAITLRLDSAIDLASLQSILNQPLAGHADLGVTASGTIDRPSAALTVHVADLAQGQYGTSKLDLDMAVAPSSGDRLHFTGSGNASGVTQNGAPPPDGIDSALKWSFDLDTDRQAQHVALTKLTVAGSGVDIDASGRLDEAALSGHAKIAADNLARFAGLAGIGLKGDVHLEADAKSIDGKSVDGAVTGELDGFGLGIPAVDAALGGKTTIDIKASRDADGKVALAGLKLDGANAALDGSGNFDPGADKVAGQVKLTLPALGPIGAAVGTPMAGSMTLVAEGSGSSQDPRLKLDIDGDGIAAGSAKIDKLTATITAPSLSARTATLSAKLTSGKIDTALDAVAGQDAKGAFLLKSLSLVGPGTHVTGTGSYAPATGRADGKLDASVEDLAAWSPLIGESVSGRVTLSADLADILGKPQGKLSLDAIKVAVPGTAVVEKATLRAQAEKAGGIGFSLSTNGNAAGKSFALATTGKVALSPATQELTLSTLDGKVATLDFKLEKPLSATRKGAAMTLANLDLGLGGGHITGNGSYDGRSVSLALKSARLAIAPLLRVAGAQDIIGTLDLDVSIAGPLTGPKGRAVVTLTDLKLAAATYPELPALRLDVSADLAPDTITSRGRLEGPNDLAALGFSGAVPIAWTGGMPALRQDGPVRAKLEGDGRLDQLSEIAPVGEDRLSGIFGINLTVGGTLAVPEAGGTFTISKGEYDNGLSGMTLRGLELSLEGSRQAFVIRHFEAGDGATGKLSVDGKVDLAASGGPLIDVSAKLTGFDVARRDEITARLAGDAHIGGPVSAPELKSTLTLERADISIPDRLPASVPQLSVIRIDSSKPPPSVKPAAPPAPPIEAKLDIRLHVPGQVFVRGRGLDSEWKGDLAIAGTSAYPEITGEFDAVNGSFALLGTSFTIQRGIVTFTGGTTPVLDLLAQAQTADITAQVTLQGLPSAPSLKLTSTPVLPQDEILSRVLFGTGVGQITPTQGLQLAQAAATLAGGGPSMLDRLRTATGLDRLSVGQAAGSSATGTAATTVSGGKYVAPGVFVGVDQGVSGTSTRAKVELSVTKHITVNATAGAASSSSSLGIQYKLDY